MKDLWKNYLAVRIIVIVLIVLLVLCLTIYLFLKLWPPFGGSPSKADKKDYAKRADNFKNGKFQPYEDFDLMSGDLWSNDFISKKGKKPREELPTETPSFLQDLEEDDLTITWLGHSTVLIQMQKLNILVDPVFSDVTSPVSFIGPKRYVDMPIDIDDLPVIDIVLITHDHYDHLDYQTIKKLDNKVRHYVVPLGVENHLERWKVDSDKITNMAWWEEIEIEGLTIGCTPAKHYSGRGLFDHNQTLWASYVLKNSYYQIYDSGDSGYGSHFQEIEKKYGEFDLVLMDSGQYNSAWHDVHMNPKESVQASKDLHATVAMPIHWGSFVLSVHAWDDPVEAFTTHALREKLNTVTPKIGETFQYQDYQNYQEKWWKDIP